MSIHVVGGGLVGLDGAPLIHKRISSVTCLRALQTDFGVTMGGTPLANGASPPAVTLTGSIAGVAAFRTEIQTTGARGTATFRYGALNDGTTSTWIETGVTTAATYNAIGPLSGLVLNFPSGTYTNDNVYQGTCSAWADQKNGASAAQANAAKQPLILYSATTRRFFLRFDGVDDNLVESTLDLPAPGTTNAFWHAVMVQRTWAASRGAFSAATTTGFMQFTGNVSTPNMQQYDGTLANTNSGASLGSLVRAEVLYTNSASDRVKIGGTNVAGTVAGNLDPAAGFIIGATTTTAANSGAFDFYYLGIYNGNPTELSSVDTSLSGIYQTILV